MYARVLTFTGTRDFDAALSLLRETALPIVRSQRGYNGMVASADRSAGVLGILSLWETEADREASESALGKAREEARSQISADLKIDLFEERVAEMRQPPAVGNAVMVTRMSMDPASVDENLEFFKREVVPQITGAPGFRTLRNMINAQTGEGMVGTVWDDRQAMEAAAEMAMARRPIAEGRGVTFGETSLREIIFADLP